MERKKLTHEEIIDLKRNSKLKVIEAFESILIILLIIISFTFTNGSFISHAIVRLLFMGLLYLSGKIVVERFNYRKNAKPYMKMLRTNVKIGFGITIAILCVTYFLLIGLKNIMGIFIPYFLIVIIVDLFFSIILKDDYRDDMKADFKEIKLKKNVITDILDGIIGDDMNNVIFSVWYNHDYTLKAFFKYVIKDNEVQIDSEKRKQWIKKLEIMYEDDNNSFLQLKYDIRKKNNNQKSFSKRAAIIFKYIVAGVTSGYFIQIMVDLYNKKGGKELFALVLIYVITIIVSILYASLLIWSIDSYDNETCEYIYSLMRQVEKNNNH